ncbi:tRNA (adenosine(37)-N6)-threonylcarbamoyltransferase complex dimerization subunit type 1 TsaB [Porticoccus sp. W117]|uniref:tRNA (adenosine(37)-N6)-threonylcarbamoyltransferase complex dimerization subunit type 1 TsaB n=1 Tax=Porticoccus sp. W117 TaxID=3054777 RepID=UPI0025975140|nr:tRNA (adenosine(37)-N6)-threonylcarbamoyltransferase complex dimerization subunit type 1 TsaB [Porticoccus sp. W117]MDM3869816.1 tRNA (adenosine(37)-N6)-threonylcarbamoyltransferase complex dimerization subunit type 1 TsaB [Porticoccus sp. W117]
MSVLLAIDTATQACSAALMVDGETRQEITLEPRSHTRLLLPMVDKLLADADLSPSQLDAIAYTAGPGSFTGLRIGFGVVQGLAFACDLPVIAVSSLHTLAVGAQRQLPVSEGMVVIPAFDARMSEVYWGAYQTTAAQPKTIAEDCLTSPEEVAMNIANIFPAENLVGVGEGWHLAQQFPLQPGAIHESLYPEAIDALSLAAANMDAAVAVEQAQLFYLRDTVSWKKRERLRPAKV